MMRQFLEEIFLLATLLCGASCTGAESLTIHHRQEAMTEQTQLVFEATFTPAPGADIEHAQGAIERNELAHREIAPLVWLIRVEPGSSAASWRDRLNSAVQENAGRFEVRPATEKQVQEVLAGVITFQQ